MIAILLKEKVKLSQDHTSRLEKYGNRTQVFNFHPHLELFQDLLSQREIKRSFQWWKWSM